MCDLGCGIVGMIVLTLFLSPVAYGIMEEKCTKMLVLNCFLWILGVIPGKTINITAQLYMYSPNT